jgi:hypothetical protein
MVNFSRKLDTFWSLALIQLSRTSGHSPQLGAGAYNTEVHLGRTSVRVRTSYNRENYHHHSLSDNPNEHPTEGRFAVQIDNPQPVSHYSAYSMQSSQVDWEVVVSVSWLKVGLPFSGDVIQTAIHHGTISPSG